MYCQEIEVFHILEICLSSRTPESDSETKIRIPVSMEVLDALGSLRPPLLASAPILQLQVLVANSSQHALFWSITFGQMGTASVRRIWQPTPPFRATSENV